jgi:hypothetical protein
MLEKELGVPSFEFSCRDILDGMHEDKFQGKYTHITTIRPEIPATIRQDVTQNMPNIILDFQDGLAYASRAVAQNKQLDICTFVRADAKDGRAFEWQSVRWSALVS